MASKSLLTIMNRLIWTNNFMNRNIECHVRFRNEITQKTISITYFLILFRYWNSLPFCHNFSFHFILPFFHFPPHGCINIARKFVYCKQYSFSHIIKYILANLGSVLRLHSISKIDTDSKLNKLRRFAFLSSALETLEIIVILDTTRNRFDALCSSASSENMEWEKEKLCFNLQNTELFLNELTVVVRI